MDMFSCNSSLPPTVSLLLFSSSQHDVERPAVLGIGVDDMFVIVQCYDQLLPEERQLPMPERIGLTMKHAGMSILVTSVTDVCAFAVGSTTVRTLRVYLCVYTCVYTHSVLFVHSFAEGCLGLIYPHPLKMVDRRN